MNPHLATIQERLDAYAAEYEQVVKEFGDEMSLSYFSDRFGPDHPLSDRADHGVRIQQDLIRMRKELQGFAERFLQAYVGITTTSSPSNEAPPDEA